MPQNIFVTGTDTAIGKTWVSLGIIAVLQDMGISTVGMKPVASGCQPTEMGLRNEDAERLQRQSSIEVDYDLINPFAFEPAIAPHIAAAEVGCEISIDKIVSCYQVLADKAECCVVEGVGGWLVPLTPRETVADLVRRLELPVILVVGIRLGCINHALLSVESIRRGGIELSGWVANQSDPEVERGEENILTLEERIDAPLLARIPCFSQPSISEFARRMASSTVISRLR
uniref:ATP-dependent dethiobiotin synthetase BioD n=1 Tax=Candidatus Kentrum sp. FW TaxID=2126338 RepID=A0A450T9H6_9GAMM|nr:MAG: dethiobiotin synthetase [Candidatus Kentron sp. FW]